VRFSWANTLLLALLAGQLVSGFLGLIRGAERDAWLLWWHGFGAYAVVLLLAWKGPIVWGVWGRGRRWTPARGGFAVLLALLILVLVSGLLWTFTGPYYLAGFSLLSLHIYLAVPLVALLAFHAWRMRWVWRRPEARDRRVVLRGLGLQAAGFLIWLGLRPARRWLDLSGAGRRFTGSYETGSFTGRFPAVSWINDRPAPIDPATYVLRVAGLTGSLSLAYADLLALADAEMTATLDCTGGFYTTQVWRGVPLARLLDLSPALLNAGTGPRSVVVRSTTGYSRRFSLDAAGGFLLATHVAGEPLSRGHGFPLRLVAPDRRGYDWVKWVTAVELSELPAIAQPPLPLQ
jgi:hypothetical protein